MIECFVCFWFLFCLFVLGLRCIVCFFQRCFFETFFTWDLTNFLSSIEAPFVTFEHTTKEDGLLPIELIFENENENKNANNNIISEFSFPFPMCDLYLNRPLVLKYYISNPNRLLKIIIRGWYYNSKNEYVFDEIEISNNSIDFIDDIKSFPFRFVSSVNEQFYFRSLYWYLQDNWLFDQYVNVNKSKINVKFLNHICASYDCESIYDFVNNLSEQCGIISPFNQQVTFLMTPNKYDQHLDEIKLAKQNIENTLNFEMKKDKKDLSKMVDDMKKKLAQAYQEFPKEQILALFVAGLIVHVTRDAGNEIGSTMNTYDGFFDWFSSGSGNNNGNCPDCPCECNDDSCDDCECRCDDECCTIM